MSESRSSPAIVRFGAFEADLESGELRKRGIKIALQDQPFRVLALLLEFPGELVTRDALRQALWPDNTFVDFERSLNTAVAKLRQSLGDVAENPRFIATVARRGYRFVAPIEKIERPGALANPSSAESAEVYAGNPSEISVEPQRRRRRAISRSPLLFALALIAGTVTVFLANRTRRRQVADARFEHMQVKRLTSTRETVAAAISPDGRYVAYAEAADGKQSLWLRQAAVSSAIQIVPPQDVVYLGLTFSRDGNLIYCSRSDKGRLTDGALYEVASLGGHVRKLLSGIVGPVSVSPDGGQFAFVRWNAAAGETFVVLANVDGSSERRLATHKLDHAFSEPAAWSPDGKFIAAGSDSGQLHESVVVLSINGGPEQLLSQGQWAGLSQLSWLPDGKSFIIAAAGPGSHDSQLWQITYPEGEVHRLTNDPNDYQGVSLTADGGTLVTIARAAPSSIWDAAADDPRSVRKLVATTSDYTWVLGLDWTADRRIIYASKANGRVDLWTIASEGGVPQQIALTSDFVPWVAAAGNGTIVFASGAPMKLNVWASDVEGSNARQLTHPGPGACPDISRDGQRIVYNIFGSGLWRIGINGDNPTLLARGSLCFPRISPDGQAVAYSYLDEQSKLPKVNVIPLAGGAAIATLNIPWDAANVCMCKRLLQWAPDGRALTYSDTHNGVSNIWSQPVDGSPPAQLTHFTSDQIFAFAWSKDGKRLALSRGTPTADAIILTGFR